MQSQNKEFTLRPTDEFIELNKLLKIVDIAQSGGHANILIEDGLVEVNGTVEFRKRKKLRANDVILAEGHTITILAST